MTVDRTNRFAVLDQGATPNASLKVVGVGGGGCNAVNTMVSKGLTGVEYFVLNTDLQALNNSLAANKIQIGAKVTRGLGAGADPEKGKAAAEEDSKQITEFLQGTDMVFVTCGMGGGTGTGATPAVAQIAQSLGILVVGIVTKPFKFENLQRRKVAEKGIQELRQHVDSLIVIPNEKLMSLVDKNTTAAAAYMKADEVLYEAVKGIADIINVHGHINLDFADVKTIMEKSGMALMGCGISSGDNRAIDAAQKAISSPLLEEMTIKGAKHVLLNFTASSKLTMYEVNQGCEVINKEAGDDINLIFGHVVDESMNDYLRVTVIATGFDDNQAAKPNLQPSSTLRVQHNPSPTPNLPIFAASDTRSNNEPPDYDEPAWKRNKISNYTQNVILKPGFTLTDPEGDIQPAYRKAANDYPKTEESASYYINHLLD